MARLRGFRCTRCNHLAWDDTSVNGWRCPVCGKGQMVNDLDVPYGALDAYAWPGGYPINYYPKNGPVPPKCDILCAPCAERLRDAGELPYGLTADVRWEGPADECDECGVSLPTAYGDPDEEADED